MQGRRTATMPYQRFAVNNMLRVLLRLEYGNFTGYATQKVYIALYTSSYQLPKDASFIDSLQGYFSGYFSGPRRLEHYWRLMHGQ